MQPVKQLYSLDVLIVSHDLPATTENDHQFSVRIYKEFVHVPNDRILAETFPEHPIAQFVASPCDLISSLTSQGICVTLSQDHAIYAAGSAELPPFVLRQLTDTNFTITHILTVQLLKRKAVVATIELNLKLECKHDEMDTRNVALGYHNICRPIDKSVNPRDVIFTLGRSKKCPATTCITDQRLMDKAGAPFDCQHAPQPAEAMGCKCYVPGSQPPRSEPDPQKQRADLQHMLKELNIEGMVTPPPSHQLPRQCECMRLCSSTESGTADDALVDGWSKDDNDESEAELIQLLDDAEARKSELGQPPVKPPDFVQTIIKPPRLCIMCSHDISWVPKMGACPYCGYKYYGETREQPYDDKLTAMQLLMNQFQQPICESGTDDESRPANETEQLGSDDPNVSKRCDCLMNRPCTRCRIRKVCENIFEMENEQRHPLAYVPDKAPSAEAGPEKKESSISQRRTQLINIFNEMRNVYGPQKTEGNQLADEILRKACEEHCACARKSTRSRRRTDRLLQKILEELQQTYSSRKKMKRKSAKCCKAKRKLHSKRYTILGPRERSSSSEKRIGHRCCISDSDYTGYRKVPCDMGWMWTKTALARNKSWRPGAISKPIRELMRYFLKDFPVDTVCLSRYHYRRHRRVESVEKEPLVQHPTLHISKKNDVYTIVLRPLKDPKSLALCANPYADMKPVVFRITKDPVLAEKRRLKRSLKKLGFSTCRCRRPVDSCFCRSFIDKKRIQEEVGNMCLRRGWPNMSDSFVYSDLSESDSEKEYDFGVTPPAGIIKPERLKDSHVVNSWTQYDENDWAMPTMFPHPPNALVQYSGCAGGERKRAFKWIYGKGNVHAEKKPPKMRNKPKKKPKKNQSRLKGGYVSEDVLKSFAMTEESQSTQSTSYTDVSGIRRISKRRKN